jgi:RND family efflux transporter MFP subunit
MLAEISSNSAKTLNHNKKIKGGLRDYMIDVTRFVKQKKIIVISIALVVVLLFTLNAAAGKGPSQDKQVSDAVTVEVQKVKYTDSKGGLTYKANLEPAEEAAVSCGVTGQVTGILFEDGDQVTQGQPLAYLDDEDLQNQMKTAKLDLNKLQLELASAERDYNTAKELYTQGACSRNNYEDAERAYKMMQNNVELRKVDIQSIGNSLDDCVIKAPISGEVGEKSLSIGEYVNPGTVIAKVKNNTSIKAVILLMQDDLEKVAAGQKVILKLGQEDEMTYQGIVKTIAASADSQTRVFECLIEIDNTSGTLNSGTFGLIEIPNPDKRQILAIPTTAVIGSEGDYSVFTVKDNTARKVSVGIGEISDEMTEITSGLQEGDVIITTNLNYLLDGDKVAVSGEGA